jgi:hypothetical protein
MSGTFGGRGDEQTFNIPSLKNGPNNPYYTIVDATTGKITLYERELGGGLLGDSELGSIEATGPNKGKFIPGKDFNKALQADDRKLLLEGEAQKLIKSKAEETAQKGCEASSSTATPEGCRERTKELLENGKATTSPDADADTVATDTLNKLNIKENPKTRNTFGDFRYPLTINDAQDVMQFVMLKYSPRELGSGDNFGFGARERVGIDGGSRKIGSATLAIQGGISDLNGCDWGEDNMNLAKLEAAKLAINAIDGAEDLGAGVNSLLGRMNNVSDDMKRALKIMYGGKAAGLNSLLKRTDGAILNPNLELLFDKPTLRPFTFTFKMSARSKKEADHIVKIIRFFKQGMAPRRSVGNLFLLAPHTFQVHYLAKGIKEHPYIGKMKECALMSLKTDYTPENNYATLPDGYMVSYQITLEMKELEPVFNDDYESDTEQQFASFREDPEENAKLQQDFLNGTANDPLPGEIGF